MKTELTFNQTTLSTGFICEPVLEGSLDEEVLREIDYYLHIAVGGVLLTVPEKEENHSRFFELLSEILPKLKEKQGTKLFFRVNLNKETMEQTWETFTKAKLLIGLALTPHVLLEIREELEVKR